MHVTHHATGENRGPYSRNFTMDERLHKHKERKHKKRERNEDAHGVHTRKKRKEKETIVRVVDDDEDEWVEKNIDLDGDKVKRPTSFNRFCVSCTLPSFLRQTFLLPKASS